MKYSELIEKIPEFEKADRFNKILQKPWEWIGLMNNIQA